MPPAPINLEPFRAQIELRIAAGQTHAKIREWLATEGIQIGRNAFSQRCVAWEASRYTRTPATDPSLAAAIDTAFHTSEHDDSTIARNITAQGIPTTRNQVEEVRLAHGWLRRGSSHTQLADARAETFALVKEALQQGTVRCYCRGLLRTYLRVVYRHQARDDDVRDALAALDAAGTESRRKGPQQET